MPRRAPRVPKRIERALDGRVNKAIAVILAATENQTISDEELADVVHRELRDVEDIFMSTLDTAWDRPAADLNEFWILQLSDMSRAPVHRRAHAAG